MASAMEPGSGLDDFLYQWQDWIAGLAGLSAALAVMLAAHFWNRRKGPPPLSR